MTNPMMTMDRPKRVMHLVDTISGEYFPEMVRAFDFHHDVYLWVIRGLEAETADRLEADGIRVVPAPAAYRHQYVMLLVRLVASLRRLKIDLIHTHLFDAGIVGVIAGRITGVPCIVHRHHDDIHHLLDRPLHIGLDRLAARGAQRVIAVSSATRDVLVLREGVPATKVRVVPNGIAFERIDQVTDRTIQALRQELVLGDRPVVTVAAKMFRLKGQSDMLNAMPQLLACEPNLVLLLAGTGPCRFRRELEDQARRLGISGAVRFLGWRRDLPCVLASSDVVVVPSLTETFGLVALEAMAVGTPVVASRVGGLPELVDDGVTGILVPPSSPDALAGAVQRLLLDADLRSRLGQAARHRARRYRLTAAVDKYQRIYEEVLGTPVTHRTTTSPP